jgi:hypothetical protein
MRCTAMGRLNGHSRKILINSPKNIALHYRMVKSACEVAPKYDTGWMIQSLHDLRRHGHIDEQWIDPQFAGRKVQPADALKKRTIKVNFQGEYKGWGNKIKGWDKLNGMHIPVV